MIDTPTLPPREARILETYLDCEDLPTLCARESLSAQALLAWSAHPAVRAALAMLRSLISFQADYHQSAPRLQAIDSLRSLLKDTDNPIERRRAATTLLRIPVFPRPCAITRGSARVMLGVRSPNSPHFTPVSSPGDIARAMAKARASKPPSKPAGKPRAARPPLALAAKTKSLLRRYPRIIAQSLLAESIQTHKAARIARTAAGANPPGPVQLLSPLESLLSFSSHDLAAVWLGHATVLMRVGGLTILTDPVLSDRIGMSLGPMTLGPQRLKRAVAEESHLPPIDAILISHAHFDHLDKPTLRRLTNKDTCVITARKTRRLIPRGFGEVFELDWDNWLDYRGVRFGALQPTHWGARAALDRRRGYNSYIIEEPGRSANEDQARRILFAGDTALTDAFNHLEQVKLAIMGIGAYQPWEHAHATPEQAWQMFRSINAEHLLPVHHSTFPLGDEHPDEPMKRLLAAAGADAHRIVARDAGTLWIPGPPA